MHRFHLPPDHWESGTLPAGESHHCANVLRLEAGARITVFDGCGREAAAVIVKANPRGVTLKVSASTKTPPPPCSITLAQAVPKGKNMDLIVQKAVELGASLIAPILSDRTVVQIDAAELEKKRAKWREVALEACKQCGQNHLPAIAKPSPPKEFFERTERVEMMLIASLQPDARPLKSILADFLPTHARLPRSVTVMVGPEGDFTPAELSLAKSNGCIPVTLGPIILRTETAAIYCLSVLAHELFHPTNS
ncbi:MAG: 16S rRNA (uracil(1498)-N(3))-methyltransferase [Terrimicrobiaceae bacterium]|jgi:16S rRNA (uracil1498-N3)-methyltransferase|nr:16S rRNA (uracil(1498)-N(3))-methyltransferase [Terrimicrobiaceae bacterium]